MKTDNELIAEFLGIKEQQGFYDSYNRDEPYWFTEWPLVGYRSDSRSLPDLSYESFLEDSKFDKSWDWLMPACQKFFSVMLNLETVESNLIRGAVERKIWDALYNRGTISDVAEELATQIKWHNEQPK